MINRLRFAIIRKHCCRTIGLSLLRPGIATDTQFIDIYVALVVKEERLVRFALCVIAAEER